MLQQQLKNDYQKLVHNSQVASSEQTDFSNLCESVIGCIRWLGDVVVGKLDLLSVVGSNPSRDTARLFLRYVTVF